MITSASMGAVISNGINATGGPYYLLSRTLGRGVGGSIGVLYGLSLITSISTSVLGAMEIFREHVLPVNLRLNDNKNTDRITGVLTLVFLLLTTSLPIKFINRAIALIGIITFIFLIFIQAGLITTFTRISDPTLVKHTPSISDTFPSSFDDSNVSETQNWISQFALFFPMVTGIMAGVNKNGLIRNAARTLPLGTLAAIFTSGSLYFITIFMLGAMIQRSALMTQQLPVLSLVAWPHPTIGLAATLAAALGAAAQSSLGVQGLMRAMARDHLLGLEHVISLSRWMPFLLTLFLTSALVLVGELNRIATLATQCFLLTYAGLNAATALGGFTRAPGWRPTWPLYHWKMSLLGTIMCISLMLVLSWWAALVALAAVFVVYEVIELYSAKGTWGAHGWWALTIQMAQRNLWRLESLPHEPGVWRPQVLAVMPSTTDVDRVAFTQAHKAMASLVGQLKKGGGLSILCDIIVNDLEPALKQDCVSNITSDLQKLVHELHLEAFTQVFVSRSRVDGLMSAVQTTGLGTLRPNTVILTFPNRILPPDARYSLNNLSTGNVWDLESASEFVTSVKSIILLEKALFLVRGLDNWPIDESQHTTIDVYWIVQDGGILRLVPWLLQRHSVWRKCRLRVFAVAQLMDNSIEMQRNLEKSLKELRIDAEAAVLEIGEQDVSEFVHEMTVRMEARHAFLQQLAETTAPKIRRYSRAHGQIIQRLNSFNATPPALIQRSLANKQKAEFFNTSIRLNTLMKEHSSYASLVFCNLPAPTAHQSSLDYVEYLESLCRGLSRIILVKGNGLELV